MRLGQLLFILILSSLTSILGFGSEKAVSSKHTQVNGFDVYLVNTHLGNGVALTTNVQAGAWHDDPVKFAGRAHLFEHVIHNGSKKYPGNTTFDNMIAETGAEYNAYTSFNRIFYHFYLHPDALPVAADLLGAMVSSPDWNIGTFEKEKPTVINEAGDYQQRDSSVLQGSIFLALLPKDHPLAMYDVGTREQLEAMKLEDLQALYNANYRPGSMQIVVAGNFDTLDEESVLKLIEEHFVGTSVPSTQASFKNKEFPSIIDKTRGNELRFVEMGTSGQNHTLQLKFESDNRFSTQNQPVLETLLDYLNLDNPGTLIDAMRQRGWGTFGAGSQTINNLTITTAYFTLTEEGAKHRAEVPELFFSALHDLQTNGIKSDVLEYLRTRNILSYSISVREADQAAELLAKALDYPNPDNYFNFTGRYGSISNDEIQKGVDLTFPIDSMICGYIGDDVKSETLGPIFNRPIRTIKDPSILESWRKARTTGGALGMAPLNVRLAKVDLPISLKPLELKDQPARVINSDLHEGTIAVLEERHGFASGAIQLELTLAPPSVKSAAALNLFIRALNLRYTAELSYLESMGIVASVGTDEGKIVVGMDGNSAATLKATEWLLQTLKSFEPTEKEISLARDGFLSSFSRGEDDFVALLSRQTGRDLLKRYAFLSADLKKEVLLLNASDVTQAVSLKLKRADIAGAFLGDYSEKQVRETLGEIANIIPQALTSKQRSLRNQENLRIGSKLAFWRKLTGNKAEDALGLTRIMAGPESHSKDYAALVVLGETLSKAIYQRNRVEQELGYVHSASFSRQGRGSNMFLVGQTEGTPRFPLIEEGWKQILAQIADGTLSKDDFAAAKTGLLRQGQLIPRNYRNAVRRILGDFRATGDPKAHEWLMKEIPTLTAAEIYSAGQRYLIDTPHLDVIATKLSPNLAISDCESIFSPVSTVSTKATVNRSFKANAGIAN